MSDGTLSLQTFLVCLEGGIATCLHARAEVSRVLAYAIATVTLALLTSYETRGCGVHCKTPWSNEDSHRRCGRLLMDIAWGLQSWLALARSHLGRAVRRLLVQLGCCR